MDTMSKQRKTKSEAAGQDPIILYVRLDADTSAALTEFLEAQPVAPERTAVTVKALREFLAHHGFWPRKGKS